MITRTLSGPPPSRRVRHSVRWRRFSLLLLTAAAILYMAYKSPGGRGGWGGEDGDVHIRVSVTRRLGMEGEKERAGDAVLSSTARSAVHRHDQEKLAGSSASVLTARNQPASSAAGREAAGAEEEEGAELAAVLRDDEAVVRAAEEQQMKGSATGGSSQGDPGPAAAAAAAAASGSAAQAAANNGNPAELGLAADDAGAAGSSAVSQGAAAAAAGGRQSSLQGAALAALEKAGFVENDSADEAAGQLGAAAATPAAAAGQRPEGGHQPRDGSEPPLSERERALRGCRTLQCVRHAHEQPKHPAQFNFPHFLILGFPKTATTSLFHHLIQHPTIMAPRVKEPNFFTTLCQGDARSCRPQEQEEYITGTMHLNLALQARLFMATFEGSVHYSQAGSWLAPQLRELMPWLKLVLSLREPISQAISMLQHNLDHGRRPACYGTDGLVFKCILRKLEDEEETSAPCLKAWADAFPADQLFVLQYENLTDASRMRGALRDVKRFVGIDTKLPHDDLGLHNSRKSERGWPMARSEYARLVELARRDAQRVASIVRQHGFADADRWLTNWERAWRDNLERCQAGPYGLCLVQLT
ncbi:hypothetical protein ABPG77_010957 [Micractinium sp. CCAP 211/92]